MKIAEQMRAAAMNVRYAQDADYTKSKHQYDKIIEQIRNASLEGRFWIETKNITNLTKKMLCNDGFNIDFLSNPQAQIDASELSSTDKKPNYARISWNYY